MDVAPALGADGFRVIVPYLRGHGPTSFLDPATPRSGQQAALGADVVALMDALDIPRAVLAGYDWGGRAACVVAALRPERCTGLVSVNGYLIQDISAAVTPIRPDLEAGFWYFYYFHTERGRAGLVADARGIAGVIWRRNSPAWSFDDAVLDRAAQAFVNPDYVDVVVHSYRHRLGLAVGAPAYVEDELRLAAGPHGISPALDGTIKFPKLATTCPRRRRRLSPTPSTRSSASGLNASAAHLVEGCRTHECVSCEPWLPARARIRPARTGVYAGISAAGQQYSVAAPWQQRDLPATIA